MASSVKKDKIPKECGKGCGKGCMKGCCEAAMLVQVHAGVGSP